jgi:hypothetical protein
VAGRAAGLRQAKAMTRIGEEQATGGAWAPLDGAPECQAGRDVQREGGTHCAAARQAEQEGRGREEEERPHQRDHQAECDPPCECRGLPLDAGHASERSLFGNEQDGAWG